MRLRKNAKNSGFLHTNSNIFSSSANANANANANASSINHETNYNKLCNLNQSPWDIITFPSSSLSYSYSPSLHPHHQFDDFETRYNVNVDEYWSSVDYIEDIWSVAFTKNCECDNGNVDDMIKDYEFYEKKDDLGSKKEEERILKCSNNTDCNIMCEDHLVDPQEDAIWASNKKARPKSSTTSRPKKRVIAKRSNPNEFYYYSGFGPSWGKKRGELGNKGTTDKAYDTDFTSNSNMHETIGGVCDLGNIEKEHKRVEPDTTMKGTSWSGEVEPKKQDLEYIIEKQDDEKQKVVKKRRRKPIKERSLKSLM